MSFSFIFCLQITCPPGCQFCSHSLFPAFVSFIIPLCSFHGIASSTAADFYFLFLFLPWCSIFYRISYSCQAIYLCKTEFLQSGESLTAFILQKWKLKSNSLSIGKLSIRAFEIKNNQSLANQINFLQSHTTLAKEPRREKALHHKTRRIIYLFFLCSIHFPCYFRITSF